MNILLFITLRWLDVLDIVLVALFISYFYSLVRGTVAMRILIGLLVILIFWKVTIALQMELVADLIGTFIGVGAIAFVIIFQPELRKFLVQLGSNKLVFDRKEKGWFVFRKSKTSSSPVINKLLIAVEEMSKTNTGAIIVIDKASDIDKIIQTGTLMDAEVSVELITAIFQKNSPLHDGAMVISKERIAASGCILPNSDRNDLPKTFGLRHRAVLGLAETTNAFVILVSEETGKIMTAQNNEYSRNLNIKKLRDQLLKQV